ncbi:MAG TPA: hypothetical protein VEY67_09465, partial [Candidatus Dormibacteraeota bacterium]|nr:hypothetical protein [Candidatus Dormibacteraeota bacterium]
MGELPGETRPGDAEAVQGAEGEAAEGPTTSGGLARGMPLDPALAERLAEARRRASEHAAHEGGRRAPRPERMQR